MPSHPVGAAVVPQTYQPPLPENSLPNIEPWNWMERSHPSRCILFNNRPPDPTCVRGSSCKLAHVYYPDSVPTDTVPHPEALGRAYVVNFNLPLESLSMSPFHTQGTADLRTGRIWYGAAFRCPTEGTIYYAAGGPAGRVNGQNMFLYPTLADGVLAASGVVLNAFASRGMHGSWDTPPPPPVNALGVGGGNAPCAPVGGNVGMLGGERGHMGGGPHRYY